MRSDWFEELAEFLRIPSISADPAHAGHVEEAGEWVCHFVRGAGGEATLVDWQGQPLAVGEIRASTPNAAPTILCYGHFDVQPPDPLELWDSEPFEPVLKNGYVFARGATDNKGQILSHIIGIQETLQKDGDLPVNVDLVIEGEEEIGSAHLGGFLEENRDALKCDVAVVSDTGMIEKGIPTMSYGLRGVTALEVKGTGPKMDLHSGVFGGA